MKDGIYCDLSHFWSVSHRRVGDEKRCSCLCDDRNIQCYASMFFGESVLFVNDFDSDDESG